MLFYSRDAIYSCHVNGFDRKRIFSSRIISRTSFAPIVAALFTGMSFGVTMYLYSIQKRKIGKEYSSV